MENETENSAIHNDSFEFSPEDVVIDPYSCDLNLVVDKECLLAYPLSNDGFCSMWAGCRSTFGVNSGKVVFEVHLEDYCECTDLPKDDQEPYLLRVGWSLNRTSIQLGENNFSYAFCSNGKKCCDKQFNDYGESFEKGDSIAAYLDFVSDKDKLIISFSKNGLDLGTAFKINKNEIEEYSKNVLNEDKIIFFPHVLSKNVVFEMNFGQRVSLIGDEPFAPIKSNFELIQKLPLDKRFSNESIVKNKKDHEVIMLIGLPGCGKTYWTNEFCKRNPKKNYYVIGVATVLEKMKMLGLKKKLNTNQSGEFTQINSITSYSTSKINPELMDKALKCINTLNEIASQSYRNIILDQANVYKSTRRRKLKIFDEYTKKAVVIVPKDDVYKERLKLSENEDGKEISIDLINDMKISFTLPDETDFDSIEYQEQSENDTFRLIESYNSQAQTDRIDLLLARRAKKNEEKRKSLGINPALLMRPIYRPNYGYGGGGFPITNSQFYSGGRFPRYGLAPGLPSARRPLTPGYPAQYTRPNISYQVPMMYSSYSMGVLQGQPGIGMANQWTPALPVSYQQHLVLMPGQQYPAYQYPGQSQQPPQQQIQNNWDPVVSTNLSQSISSSVYSTNMTNININNNNQNNDQ